MSSMNPRLEHGEVNVMFRIGALVHGRADVIHLEFGEPNFATPAHIVAAAENSLANERQTYGPGPGLPSLRAAIAERVARVNRFAPQPEQVVATMGGTGGLMNAALALCEPGDEVLTPDPAWPGYDAMVATAGGTQIRYPLLPTQGWEPDLDALEAACTPRAKVLILNSPGNPTGAVFSRKMIEQLVEFAQKHDLWILSDECYDQLIYSGQHLSPATLDAERVVTIGSCSKSYAMTGWRVGWAVAPKRVAAAIGIASTAAINNIPTFAQRAAEAALTGPQECIAEMRAAYRRRRDLASKILDEHGLLEYTPNGAFYLLIDVARASGLSADEPFDSVAFAEALLSEKGIAVGPGAAFGKRIPRYVRVSLARGDDEIQAGITGALDFAREYAERALTRRTRYRASRKPALNIILQPYLTSTELEQRYRMAKEPKERSWWQVLWLLCQGRTRREVATVTGYSPYWIGQIAKRYNAEGPDGMRNRRRTTSHRSRRPGALDGD